MGEAFDGFDDIKRQYPSAEYVEIVLPLDQQPISLLAAIGPYIGKINSATFRNHPPETLMLMGPRAETGNPTARIGFVSRSEGWNTAYCDETGKWESISHVATGKGPVELADFGQLSVIIGN